MREADFFILDLHCGGDVYRGYCVIPGCAGCGDAEIAEFYVPGAGVGLLDAGYGEAGVLDEGADC